MNAMLFVVGFVAGVGAAFGMYTMVHFQLTDGAGNRR